MECRTQGQAQNTRQESQKGIEPWDVKIRVLRGNTIKMRLVGAPAAAFLIRGKSEQKEWQFNDMVVKCLATSCDVLPSGVGAGGQECVEVQSI